MKTARVTYCNEVCPCETPCRVSREESEFDRRAERERAAILAALNDGGYGDPLPPVVDGSAFSVAEVRKLFGVDDPRFDAAFPEPAVRTFDTGATRDTDAGKPDYEAYLSPAVIARFGVYMTEHRRQSDGALRAGDNWQKGIPMDAYMKSSWRHFVDVWTLHRGDDADDQLEDALCALLFNVQGYLHELMKARA